MTSNSTFTPVSSRRWYGIAAMVLLCAGFVAIGCAFIRRFGIEVDEALVGNGIYPRAAAIYSWKIGDAEIPVMLLSYLGAMKTWMYNLIFAIWPPGPLPLRLPTLLFGVAAILLFFAILRRVASGRAAWIGAVLLATDPSFLLNEAIDFGPVALHHLLKLGAVWFLLRYAEESRARQLAAGFFLLGLAMWDKAIFAWALAGLVIAASAIYPRDVLRRLSLRTCGVAAVAFLIGASPLIVYNIVKPLDTFRSNAHFSGENPLAKTVLLRSTINGSAMFGFFTAPLPGPRPGSPHNAMERGSLALSNAMGRSTNYNVAATVLALLAIPLLWRSRVRGAMLFAAVYLVVTWVQMAITTGAGAAAHHVLLLWPAHLFLIALAIDGLSEHLGKRALPIAACATLLLAGTNMLVINQYAVELLRNGTSVRWSDAFPGLAQKLESTKAEHVFVADWGILETINLMTEGTVPVVGVGVPDIGPPLFAQPDDLFVGHGPEFVQFPQIGAKLEQTAAQLGLEKVPVATVYDRNGRGIFEVFRYRRR